MSKLFVKTLTKRVIIPGLGEVVVEDIPLEKQKEMVLEGTHLLEISAEGLNKPVFKAADLIVRIKAATTKEDIERFIGLSNSSKVYKLGMDRMVKLGITKTFIS